MYTIVAHGCSPAQRDTQQAFKVVPNTTER